MQPPETETATPSSRRRRAGEARSPSEHILRLHGHTVRFKEATLQYVGVLTVLLILIAIFSYLQPQFHTWTNFLNILETNATLLILSVGLTFVLLVGGFDLSIGGVLALAGVCVGEAARAGRRHLRLDDHRDPRRDRRRDRLQRLSRSRSSARTSS